jgi:LPS-assembly lipoprotein
MWWRSPLAALALALAALPLAGCGFQPLYGSTASGSRLAEVMSAVQVTPIPGRVGQKVRNELIFANTGGDTAAPSKYRLDIVVRESVTDELVRQSGDSVGQVYQLTATFKLVNISDGKVMFEGGAMSRAAFERFQQIYSNVRARYDAENRAATTVAESIKTRVAAFLSNAA